MQRNILKQFNKRILCILILSIIIYIIASIIPQLMNKSYAATYTYKSGSNNLPADFDTKYPGYRILINTLVTEHPYWTFNLFETGLEWNTVIDNENVHGKNLVEPGYYTPEWGCSCDTAYDGVWKCASKASIEYMMDPRNFLNNNGVFQFQDLSSSNADESAVGNMISGTFMDNDAHRAECVRAIMDAAQKYNISPYFITSKIIQEQSTNGSELSWGLGCDVNGDGIKEYVGYYNLFNIGAYEENGKSQVENGLIKAQEKGWDSMYKSILSGAELLKGSYIAVGQTTPYFQKYNVVNKNNLYYNQYMTNIWGAYSEGKIMKSKYTSYGIVENKFTFTIPLYTGMPAMKGELVYVNVNPDSSLGLKAGAYFNSTRLVDIAPNTVLLRIEKAEAMVDGRYWDKVITPYGVGYMARNAADNKKQYLIPITLIEPTDNEIDTSKQNGYTNPDGNNIICAEPNVTVNKIKETYTNSIIVDKNGNEITGNTLVGTGAKIKIDGVEKYTIVKLGDTTGDGFVDAIDLLRIRNHLIGKDILINEYLKAMDIYADGACDAIDLLKLRKYLTEVEEIEV